MKRNKMFGLLFTVVLVLTLMVVGCGDDDDPDPLNVTGTWRIVAIGFPTMNAVLTHSGNNIVGTVSDASDYSRTIAGSTVASSGETEPRTITLTITFSDGQVATLTGSVGDDNNSMSGTYSDNFGGSDSWSATRQ